MLKHHVATILLLVLLGVLSSVAAQPPLRVVAEVDYARYAGVWYEIARLPNRFEEACASDITATYTPRPDGRIDVVNRCRKADGSMKDAAGIARRVKGQPTSVLQVRFAPAFLSFIPAVWGDYRVISLSPEYTHALVGSEDRKYLWILARDPQLSPDVYKAVVAEADTQGFAVSRLIVTPHGQGR